MKGVSPIIATILLIAVAISVGIMITTWITHWVVTQTGSSSLECSVNTLYTIDSAEFNKTAALNSTLLLKITNEGTEGIYGFGAILDNGTYIESMNSSNTLIWQGNKSSTTPLNQKESVYVTVNLNGSSTYMMLGRTLTKVVVKNDKCPSISGSTTTITKYNY